MRVLHVISSLAPESGGPSTALEGFVMAQRAQGLSVSVITTFQSEINQTMSDAFARAGVSCRNVGPARGRLRRHAGLAPVLDAALAEVDVVHAHGIWEEIQFLASRAARRRKVPFVLRPCGMLSPYSMQKSSVAKRLYLTWRGETMLRAAATVHCTSAKESGEIESIFPGVCTTVVRNGVDPTVFATPLSGSEFRRRRLGGFDGRIALHLGRLAPKKNLAFAIDAFAAAGVKDAKLVIAGPSDPGMSEKLVQRVEAARLSDRVVFLGAVYGAERLELLAAADAFVIPSLDENFANALLEAVAVGTPALSSPHVALAEEGASLGVVRIVPLNLDAWTGAFRDALRQPRLTRELSASVLRRFDWNAIASEWTTHYRRLGSVS